MKVGGTSYRTIWVAADGVSIEIIDQTKLPHDFVVAKLASLDDAAGAIADMLVRGAPLIGVTAAYGLCLALQSDASDAAMIRAAKVLEATRPTAVNLRAALAHMLERLERVSSGERARAAYALAADLADQDVAQNHAIGEHGLEILRANRLPGRAMQVMTHCNAGWLATVDGGTALAPIYAAHDAGLPVHVWVSETRPRNQGASLTAWELGEHGVPFTAIVDNAAGHLMQRGEVDLVIVGTDRTTRSGDVANKIGTYLKAVAARDCSVPFYVAVPSSSIDWTIDEGSQIPIEERAALEITHVPGRASNGRADAVRVLPLGAGVRNFGFDVTPARLVTGLITERGVCAASPVGIATLFPERAEARLG